MAQRCSTLLFLTLFGLLPALMPLAWAETLQVLTEEFPLYNYTEKGHLTGFATAVVRAVLQEAQIAGEFQSQPWARAYETAQHANSVLIYSITRTAQREHLFKWIGPIAPADSYLYSLPQRKLQFTQLEQAKRYQIATVNEDAGEQFLISRGFQKGKNLQSSIKYELNYDKLKQGRVDLWIMTELVATYMVRQAGDDPTRSLTRSYAVRELSDASLYMAFSTQTPDVLVERLRTALAHLKKNGSYDALKKKWL